MLSEDKYYQKERRHLSHRLVVLIGITIFALLLSQDMLYTISLELYIISFVFVGMSILSIYHFIFIYYYPSFLIFYRKVFIILMDLSALSYLLLVLEDYGLFFFPVYIIIVIQSGLIFGIFY